MADTPRKTRAPDSDPGTVAKRQKGGRPRTVLSEELLRSALEAGADYGAIAAANGCSKRTIDRRVKAARDKHGQAWGRPLVPEPPPPPPPVELGDEEADGQAAVAEAMVLLRKALRGTKVQPEQLAAVKIALAHADLLRAEGRTEEPTDHEHLLAKVAKATAPPEPPLSEEDLAPTGTFGDGAPDAAPTNGHATPGSCQKPVMVDPR